MGKTPPPPLVAPRRPGFTLEEWCRAEAEREYDAHLRGDEYAYRSPESAGLTLVESRYITPDGLKVTEDLYVNLSEPRRPVAVPMRPLSPSIRC